MIPKEIIEKAREGGYTDYVVLSVPEIICDPLFWQSLGKALRWEGFLFVERQKEQSRIDEAFGISKVMIGASVPKWQYEAHQFFDLLLTNGNTDGFWQSIMK